MSDDPLDRIEDPGRKGKPEGSKKRGDYGSEGAALEAGSLARKFASDAEMRRFIKALKSHKRESKNIEDRRGKRKKSSDHKKSKSKKDKDDD